MDIRTKLVFALVAVSLGSMFALGSFSYLEARELLRDNALRQLQALAESKKQDLENVSVGWRDRVALITTRRDLGANLAAAREGHAPDAERRAERILEDAVAAVPSLRGVAVFTPEGRKVAATGVDPDPDARVQPASFWMADSPLVYENVNRDPDGGLVVTFVAPVRLDGTLVGAAKVVLSARELLAVAENFTGLGETGEVLLARRTEEGDALILNPLRHDPDAMLTRVISAESSSDPTVAAVKGLEAMWRRGARDYRGVAVLAASRHLKEFDWGLVVKVDVAEQLRPVMELRSTMWRLALSLLRHRGGHGPGAVLRAADPRAGRGGLAHSRGRAGPARQAALRGRDRTAGRDLQPHGRGAGGGQPGARTQDALRPAVIPGDPAR
jgi:hypothetical protein